MSTILQSPKELRYLIRSGEFKEPTSGQCPGFVQANVVILPESYADDFRRFCELNPSACPLLCNHLKPGSWEPKELAVGADVRTDIPQYVIHKFMGEKEIKHRIDEGSLFSDDMVTFFLGCSFTFEEALLSEGLPVRNIEEGRNVSMYTTSIDCKSSGPFYGKIVATMRPFKKEQIDQVINITSSIPKYHGAPIHIGNPEKLGINDLNKPDFGDPVTVHDDEIPVFWACGVTTQVALNNAMIRPHAITHAPGHMFVTDQSMRS